MALVNVEASALLVGEEGFNSKSSPIIATGFIGLFQIGDEKDGFFILHTPPSNDIQRQGGRLCEADIVQIEELALLQRVVSNRLTTFLGLNINLRRGAQNILPSCVLLDPVQHFTRIVLSIA